MQFGAGLNGVGYGGNQARKKKNFKKIRQRDLPCPQSFFSRNFPREWCDSVLPGDTLTGILSGNQGSSFCLNSSQIMTDFQSSFT